MGAEPRNVDFGNRSDDYATHRPGFPSSFYDRLATFVHLDGAEALDVGTGPAIVALELARRGANVTGIDIADNQLGAARARVASANLTERCRFVRAPVERTGLRAERFHLATAGQCWIWFDERAAIAELHRVLRPRGVLVVAHYCYLPAHSPVARATEDLILRHNPDWTLAGHTGLYPQQIDPLILGGFELLEQFCYDHDRVFTHAGWRGRMRTCNGVGSGGLDEDGVARFDRELAELLRDRFPSETVVIRHRVWASIVRRP